MFHNVKFIWFKGFLVCFANGYQTIKRVSVSKCKSLLFWRVWCLNVF
jgi:hypothetical protein